MAFQVKHVKVKKVKKETGFFYVGTVDRKTKMELKPHPPSLTTRLAAAAPAMCRGEESPLAMKQSIRMASALLGGGVRRHLLLYNSANRPTHQFCSLRD